MKVRRLPELMALLSVYIFWGGTYLAMKFAIETMSPFVMAGSRFILAGSILFIFALIRGAKWPDLIQWKNACVVGALLLLGGNGGVVWAEQMVPSGIAAIIVATVPLWMALISWLCHRQEKPKRMVIFGLFLGFFGIMLLVNNSLGFRGNSPVNWIGYAVLIFASFSWAVGSLYSRTVNLPGSALMSTSLQMLTGGLLFLGAGFLSGEWAVLDITKISVRSALSLGYLVIFGSIVAFSSYIWLLKVANPTVVSTYAYVNPVVAVGLGWLFAGEKLTAPDVLAVIIILSSVVIITKNNSKKPEKTNQVKCDENHRFSGLGGRGT